MDLAESLALDAELVQENLKYLPLPNHVDVVLSGAVAPRALTRTAFILPFFRDGTFVMACNQRRGAEIPGGHIDGDQTAEEAAVREGWEETGARVSLIRPLGFLRMISGGTVPEGWKYPHPVGFQQFFTGCVDTLEDYAPNDECAMPLLVTPPMAMASEGPLNPGQRVFYLAAFRMLFGREPEDRVCPGFGSKGS